VMPYLRGGTLKEYLNRQGKLDWKDAARLLIPVAEGLDYAHEQNVIHRDVKPSNILLTAKLQPMLTDFGVAKIIDEEVTQDLTGTSATVGTPEYMAPEQVMSKTVDHRADIYALGVVFFELVTGRRPFEADTPMAVLFKHAGEPLPRASAFTPDLPETVEKILFKALAKKPEERYQSMGELALAFEKIITGSNPVHVEDQKITEAADNTDKNTLISEPVDSLSLETRLEEAVSENQQILSTQTENVIEINLGSEVKMRFIRIPASKFLMGSDPMIDPIAEKDELPQHAVYLDEYWMGETPVTNEQYLAFIEATNATPPVDWKNGQPKSGKKLHPVVNVNFKDAQRFCEWLSKSSRKKVRLPSEAEWEKAARGTDGRKYPWGNMNPDNELARFNRMLGSTDSVFAHPDGASPYGVLDMAGNVWEWTADWYGSYPSRAVTNPPGPSSGDEKVIRGGSWSSDTYYLRSANRLGSDPNKSSDLKGFRCAFSL